VRVDKAYGVELMRPQSNIISPLLLVALLFPSPGFADQNDPRLDPLFERIKRTDDLQDAAEIESSIWQIWVDAGNPELNRLMQAGIEAMASNQLDLAIELFTMVIQESPSFAEGWNKRATAFYLNGEIAASVGDIERTLALEPRHFGAVSGLGLIFLSRGDKVGALNAFERVLEINPNAAGARAHVRLLKEALKGQGV